MIAVVQRRLNWWLFGNVLYGGPIGLGIDFVGGGAYNPTVVYLAESTKTVHQMRQLEIPRHFRDQR